MANEYALTIWGLVIIIATLLLQSFIAAIVKAKQPGAVPGKMSTEISHESFVFRSNRCIANSLENALMMLSTVFLAIFANANPKWIGMYTLAYALARIGHMVLYYMIATEKNPSPRSYFYLLGFLANIGLLAHICLILIL
jgi:uncharacterized MAPEG superfamily protein